MRHLIIVLGLLLCALPAFGQSTTVSGTITDAGGQAWSFGTVQFTFRPSNSNPTAQYFWNGAPFDKNTTIPATPLALDGSGSFSGVVVPSNTSITPSGSTWTVQACPAATTPCFSQNLTITGGSETISAFIIPAAINLNLSVPLLGARAYTDPEVSGALPGTMYFNLTDNRMHVCLQTGFPPCTWFVLNGGAGTVSNFTAGSLSPLFTTSVANPTTAPALSFALSNAPSGTIYGNPTGGSAAPGFFAPSAFSGVGTGTVTSFSAGTGNPFFTTSVSNPTTTPALSFNTNFQSANCVFAGPASGGSAATTCRPLVGLDLPNPSASTLGGIESAAPVTHQWIDSISTLGVPHQSQPTTNDISGLGTTQIQVTIITSGICTTSGGETFCSMGPFNWPTSFADANYAVMCSTVRPTGSGGNPGIYPLYYGSKSATQFSLVMQAGSNSAGGNNTVAEISCIGVHP